MKALASQFKAACLVSSLWTRSALICVLNAEIPSSAELTNELWAARSQRRDWSAVHRIIHQNKDISPSLRSLYTVAQVLVLKVLWPIKIISDLCLLLQWSEGKGCKVTAELIIRGRTRERDVDGEERCVPQPVALSLALPWSNVSFCSSGFEKQTLNVFCTAPLIR